MAAAAPGDRGGVPVLEQRPGPSLPPEGGHPGRPRDGGDRPGDGLRQPRGDLGDRRPVHAEPGDRRADALRRRHVRRPGRGRCRRDASDRADRRAGPAHALGRRRAARRRDAAGAPLRRPVRHRVHDRGGPALDAPGPGRQAEPPGRAADRPRHGRGRDVPGVAGGRGRASRPAAGPSADHDECPQQLRPSRLRPACRHHRGWRAARSSPAPRLPRKRPRRDGRRSSSGPRPRPTTSTGWPGRPGS